MMMALSIGLSDGLTGVPKELRLVRPKHCDSCAQSTATRAPKAGLTRRPGRDTVAKVTFG